VAAEGTPADRDRSRLVQVLLVIASLLAMVAIFSAWIERQALDTDEWVETSAALLEKEEIRTALSQYAVDELYAEVDVEADIRRRLPPELKSLASPIAAGLRSAGQQAADRVLASPRFEGVWEEANRGAHGELLDIVEDRGPIAERGGAAELDLRTLLIEVAQELGLSGKRLEKLPPTVAQLRIMRADQIETGQAIASAIKGIAILTTLGTLLLLAAAIYFAGSRRWAAVLGAGVGLVAAGVIVLILRKIAGGVVVDSLASPAAEPAADQAWSVGTSLLRSIAWHVVVLGLLFALAGWLGSPAESARSARRTIGPVLRDHLAIVIVVLAVPLAIWVLDGADSTRVLLMRLALCAFLAVGLAVLHRDAQAEHPGAPAP